MLTILSSERDEADFASHCIALVLFGVRAYNSIFGSSANFDTMLPAFCSNFWSALGLDFGSILPLRGRAMDTLHKRHFVLTTHGF